MTSLLAMLPAAVDPGVTPDDGGSPGFLGFVVTFALAVVLVLLALSLVRHLRKVDRTAPPEDTGPVASEDVGPIPPTSSDAGGGDGGQSGGDQSGGDQVGGDRMSGRGA